MKIRTFTLASKCGIHTCQNNINWFTQDLCTNHTVLALQICRLIYWYTNVTQVYMQIHANLHRYETENEHF